MEKGSTQKQPQKLSAGIMIIFTMILTSVKNHFIEHIVSETLDKNIREFFVYSFRVIYEINKKDISVLAVIHSKREISKGDI